MNAARALPQPEIRRAVAADLPALKALVESAYRGESAKGGWTHEAHLLTGERVSMAELTANVADPAMRVLVAEAADGALLATMTVSAPTAPGRPAYLAMLAVAPGAQAGGLGRRMIAACEAAAARELGASACEMSVIASRHELIAYYQRRGYRLTGEQRPFPYAEGAAAGLVLVVLERSL